MLKVTLYLGLFIYAATQLSTTYGLRPPPHDEPNKLRLCNYANITYNKCLRTRQAADSNAIDLPLACVQKSNRDDCIKDVQAHKSDMVVLEEHDYQAARKKDLIPFLYANVSRKDYYVAVAPRDISLINYFEAPLSLDLEDHRAFHAAIYFNKLRGRNICPQSRIAHRVTINITSSANFTSDDDNLLICAFAGYNTEGNVAACNWDVGLQRAVFVPKAANDKQRSAIKKLFDKIVKEFVENADANVFNFFGEFLGEHDVIFEDNTISLDLEPTYINGIDEAIFNALHCDKPDDDHDPDQVDNSDE